MGVYLELERWPSGGRPYAKSASLASPAGLLDSSVRKILLSKTDLVYDARKYKIKQSTKEEKKRKKI